MDRRAHREFRRLADRVDRLLARVEDLAPDGPREDCLEAVQAVLDLHQQGLSRLLGLLRPEEMDRLTADEVVSGLLVLHGLHPRSLEERVERALAEVRPYLASHGGDVEVVSLDGEGLRLRLQGNCHGCPSSLATLRGTIEQTLAERAPDLPSLHVDGAAERAAPPASPGFVSVGSIGRRGPDSEWQVTPALEARLEARSVNGTPVLLCRAEGVALAYRDRCPVCTQRLAGSRLEGRSLTCSVCGTTYDVRAAGRSPQAPEQHLEPVPLLAAEGGGLRLQLPVPHAPAYLTP